MTLGPDFCEDSGLEFSTKNSKVLVAPRKRFTRSKHALGIPFCVSSSRVACKTFLDPDEELIFSCLLGTGTLAINKVACRCKLLSNTFLEEPDVSSGSVRSVKMQNRSFLPTCQLFNFKQHTVLAWWRAQLNEYKMHNPFHRWNKHTPFLLCPTCYWNL